MDLLGRIANGLAAARAAVGSDEASPVRELLCEDTSIRLKVGLRRKRPDGPDFIRIETKFGDGLARIDLSPADARMLGNTLITMADDHAAAAAKPIALRDITPKEG
jgi:hypothetical protein